MTASGADGFLHLLAAEPSLLPPAPADAAEVGAAIEHRRTGENHICLRCGGPAECAFIAITKLGSRWLDLCHSCTCWLQTTAS